MKDRTEQEAMAAISKMIGVPIEELESISVIRVDPDTGPVEVSLSEAASDILGAAEPGEPTETAEEMFDAVTNRKSEDLPKPPPGDLEKAEDYLLDWAKSSGFSEHHNPGKSCLTIALLAKRLVESRGNKDKTLDHIAAILVHLMLVANASGTILSESFDFSVNELERAKADTRSQTEKAMAQLEETLRYIREGRKL